MSDKVTTSSRYIRHYFNADNSSGGDVRLTDETNVISQTNSFLISSTNVFVGATIHTEERGNITALYRMGGSAISNRGDRVFWGYFYANPQDLVWGNQNNPEVFVKIWYDISGRTDVNFFHVSVPNIEIWSSIGPGYAATSKKYSTLTMDKRYVRHEYTK